MIKNRPLKFKHFAQTLLLIVEDGTKTNFPPSLCCLLILVLFFQKAGYIFNNYESKPLFEHNIKYFAHWMEYSPGTFLLFISAKDALTIFFYTLFLTILFSYIVYIIVLTFIRRWSPKTLKKMRTFKNWVNFVLRLFFSLFLWIFYIPFTEINAGIAVCGDNSFLNEYRNKEGCANKPTYQVLLGWTGVVLTFLTGFLLNYMFVNYDFQDKNMLKRRFKPNLVIQILFRTLLISFYYVNISNVIIIKHLCSHVIGLSCCYDFFRYFPFKNKTVSIFYGSCCTIYEFTMILFSAWELTDYLPEYDLFHLWVISIPLAIAAVIIFWNIKYEQINCISIGTDASKHLDYLDHYLEELHTLSETSQNIKVSKLRLMGLLEQHMRECTDRTCLLQRDSALGQYLDQNYQIDKTKIIKIINNFFTLALTNKYFKDHQSEREFMSLKFYTFLSNFQDNPVRGYYELKSMLHKEKKKDNTSSLLFRLLSKIISHNIEELILQYLDQSGNRLESNKTFSSRNEYLNSLSLYRYENFKNEFANKFSAVLQSKIQFWEGLMKGYDSLEVGKRNILSVIAQVKEMREDFANEMRELELQYGDKENVIYLKMLSIYNTVIMNDNHISYKLENKILEIKKRDSVSSKENLTSISILRGLSTVFVASVLEETGRLVGPSSEKQARVFGYEKAEFVSLTHVNQLMPSSISEIHHLLIKEYVATGKSRMLRSSKIVYGIDREKFMFPLRLFLNYHFEFSSNFVILGAVTRLDTTFANILCDHNGRIDGVSRNFYEALGLNPTATHSAILGRCNILLLIPSLFDKINSKNFDKIAAEKDQYIDLFVNERMEIIIPNDVKSFIDGFNYAESSKSLKTEWKSKKFQKRIETYITEGSEAKLSRKIIITNMKCRSLRLGENNHRMFYYLEISEIYTENLTSTFMTHNTFAVSATKNDSVEEGNLQLSDHSLTKQQGTDSKRVKTFQSVRDSNRLEVIKEHQESPQKEIKMEIKVDLASSSRGFKSSERSLSEDERVYLPSENMDGSSININTETDQQEGPMESRRVPFQRPSFLKGELKPEDYFDPRHEESVPIIESANILELEGEHRLMSNELPGHDDELEEKESSSDEKPKGEKKFDLLRAVLKGRSFKSNTLTKNKVEDEDQLFQKSVHSTSSMKTSYGSAFLKEIMNNFKYPKILTRLKLIGIVEILSFLAINIVYVFLISGRLRDFTKNVDKMTYSGILTQAFTRSLITSNFEYLIDQHYISNLTEQHITIARKIEENSYEALRDFLYNKQVTSIIPEFRLGKHELIRVQDSQIFSDSADEFGFFDLLLNKLRNQQLLRTQLLTDVEKLDEYLFLRLNFLETLKNSDVILDKYLGLGTDDAAAVRLFYLVISIVGLTTAMFLQLLNLPFLRMFFIHMQKLILLITRVTAEECKTEIKTLKKFADTLSSKTDDYLNYDFQSDRIGEETSMFQPNHIKQEQLKRNKATSIYLSSKMSVQKLNTLPKYLIIMILILIVSLYFSGLLIFLNEIENHLKLSVDLNQSLMKLTTNMNSIQSEFNILLSTQNLPENAFTKSEEKEQMLRHFQQAYANLKEFRTDVLMTKTMREIPSSFIEMFENVLNNNLCLFLKISYCDSTKDNIFKAGLLGYLSYWVAESEELISVLSQENIKAKEVADRFFSSDKLFDRIVATYSFIDLSESLKTLYNQIIDHGSVNVESKLTIIFVIGGLGCSLILLIFLTVLFLNIQKELIFTRMGLLLIPYKKLSDETVIYLLKNLESI